MSSTSRLAGFGASLILLLVEVGGRVGGSSPWLAVTTGAAG